LSESYNTFSKAKLLYLDKIGEGKQTTCAIALGWWGTGRGGTTPPHHAQGISSWKPCFGEGWERAEGQNLLATENRFAILVTKLLRYHNTFFKQLITNLLKH